MKILRLIFAVPLILCGLVSLVILALAIDNVCTGGAMLSRLQSLASEFIKAVS